MTSSISIADRFARLAQAFHQLKDRVREAVAHEMGKVVGDAVRGWITAALQSRRVPPRYPDVEERHPYDDGWDDEPGDWYDPAPEVVPPPAEPSPPRWPAALSLGLVTARWLLARRLPFVASLGAGLLAGACALAGGPLVRSALTAATAAADLARVARPESVSSC